MGKSKRDRELEFEVQAPPQKKNFARVSPRFDVGEWSHPSHRKR